MRYVAIAAVAVLLITPASAELPDPLAAGWKAKPVCDKLHEDDANRILRCTFPPGVGHERHFHARHFGYAISGGRARITDAKGTREVELETGSQLARVAQRALVFRIAFRPALQALEILLPSLVIFKQTG